MLDTVSTIESNKGLKYIVYYLAGVMGFFIGSFVISFFCSGVSCPLPPNEIGDYFAGMTTPAVLLWLILSYRQQSKDLELQVKELRKSVEAQKMQADAVKQTSLHSARDTFLQYLNLIVDELSSHAFEMLRIHPDGGAIQRRIEENSPTTRLFDILTLYINNRSENIRNSFSGRDSEYWQCLDSYAYTFQYLIREAVQADSSHNIAKFLIHSSYGRLYHAILDKLSEYITVNKLDYRRGNLNL
jgi:hypothetical protein